MIRALSRIGKSLFGKYISYQAWLSGVVVGVIAGQAWICFLVWLLFRGRPLPFVGGP